MSLNRATSISAKHDTGWLTNTLEKSKFMILPEHCHSVTRTVDMISAKTQQLVHFITFYHKKHEGIDQNKRLFQLRSQKQNRYDADRYLHEVHNSNQAPLNQFQKITVFGFPNYYGPEAG